MIQQHPQQMISEFSLGLDSDIRNFFQEHSQKFNISSLDQLVEEILGEFFIEMDKTSIKDAAEKLRRRQHKTKSRWYSSYMSRQEQYPDISNPKNVYHIYYEQHKFLSQSEWTALYGNVSINQIVEEKDKEVCEWKSTRSSKLIGFPLIQTKQPVHIYSAFRLDAALNIYNLIKRDYNGSLYQFFRSYPQELLDKPLFSPSSYDVALREYSGQLIEDFFPSGENTPMLRMVNDEDTSMVLRVFDSKDIAILSMFLANVDTSFYSTRSITVSLSDIASLLYPGKLSEWHYEDAKRRCLDFRKRHYEYTNNTTESAFAFNYFDNVYVSGKDEKRQVTLAFGELFYRAIIDRKLVSVTSKNYESLENPLSRIIYYTLQRERINLAIKGKDTEKPLIAEYEYSFFQQAVRFHKNKKSQNIKLINTSLDDFVSNRIAIKSYEINSNGHWLITYYPLTDAEYADLEFNNKNISENDIIDI